MKKECLHTFRSVYYGCEWAVECSKCNSDIYDLYSKNDANYLIELMIKNSKQINYKNTKWEERN